MANLGRFVWFDLMTSDTKAAQAFYKETLGWTTSQWGGTGADYTLLHAGDRPMGGLMALTDELKDMKVPPHWSGSIQVDDVDAVCAKAEELGGRLYKPAWDIPQTGRIAVLADPQGAVFNVYKPLDEKPMPAEGTDILGEMSWHELNTTDYEAAGRFYSSLFGWKVAQSMDIGEGVGTYVLYKRDGVETYLVGMSNAATKMNVPAHWLHYTNVDSCSSGIERIKSKGGALFMGPMEVPGGGWVAMCQDPQGAMFAIYSRTE